MKARYTDNKRIQLRAQCRVLIKFVIEIQHYVSAILQLSNFCYPQILMCVIQFISNIIMIDFNRNKISYLSVVVGANYKSNHHTKTSRNCLQIRASNF